MIRFPTDIEGGSEARTAATSATVRSVYIIGPDKLIKLIMTYPMTTGRNFDEILRVIDSMQLTARHQVATPVNWTDGNKVIIVPAVSDEEAEKKYPQGFRKIKPYLRFVDQPKQGAVKPSGITQHWPQACRTQPPRGGARPRQA